MGWLNAGTETYWTKVIKHPFFQQKHWDIDGICKLDCKTETGMEHIDTKNREDAKDGMMLCWGFYFIDLWLQRSYEKISVYNGVFWFHLMKRKWHSKGSITLEKHHQSSSSNRQCDHDFVGSNQNVIVSWQQGRSSQTQTSNCLIVLFTESSIGGNSRLYRENGQCDVEFP